MSAQPDPYSKNTGYYRIWDDKTGWYDVDDLPWPSRNYRYRFDVDDDGWWWLINHHWRSNRNPWRPESPWEALVAVNLLYVLNDLKSMPIEGDLLRGAEEIKMPLTALRWELKKASVHLWWRRLIK